MELNSQKFGGFFAKYHSLHKNFKVLHYRRNTLVNGKVKYKLGFIFIKLNLGLFYRKIHPVVDILRQTFDIAHPAAANICLVSNYKSCRDRI